MNNLSQRLSQAKQKGLTHRDLLRLELLGSLGNFTKAMFKAQYNKPFVTAPHHEQLFKLFEDIVDGHYKKVIINMPPRYSKTEVCVKCFSAWGYALNNLCKFLHLSYSDLLVNDNSKTIRDIMTLPLYKELFPEARLEREKGGADRWKTTQGGEFYAVSTQGQVTGFGAGQVADPTKEDTDYLWSQESDELMQMLGMIGANSNVFNGAVIIDDPMKPEDALSDTVRERINQRFENTIRNRVNSRDTPIIIIMQRLHEHDLCGYLLEKEPDEWHVLSLPAIQEDEQGNQEALWPFKHTLKELAKMRELDTNVFDTQYMQDPKPKEGLMYDEFGTYSEIPYEPGMKRCNYTDTADTGADSLCSIDFVMTDEYNYVLDVLYTKDPMEMTEPATARMISKDKIELSRIESNNGGRGFARAVQRIMKTAFGNFRTKVSWFTQSQNKYVRIFTSSAEVQNTVLFPVGWEKKWPKFYNDLTSYRKDNRKRSQHDDAPDALTGTYEMRAHVKKKKKPRQVNSFMGR